MSYEWDPHFTVEHVVSLIRVNADITLRYRYKSSPEPIHECIERFRFPYKAHEDASVTVRWPMIRRPCFWCNGIIPGVSYLEYMEHIAESQNQVSDEMDRERECVCTTMRKMDSFCFQALDAVQFCKVKGFHELGAWLQSIKDDHSTLSALENLAINQG